MNRYFRQSWIGLAAGLASSPALIATQDNTLVAIALAAIIFGSSSLALGVVINMIVSAFLGMSYGLLFRHEVPDAGSAIAWGLVYGLLWWFIGPMTLQPISAGALAGLPKPPPRFFRLW